MRNYYRKIREYLEEFSAYVYEDDIHYTKKQMQRLEDLVEKAKNRALVESIQKSLER